MELTEKQKQGLAIAIDRYKRGEKATVIAGFARNRQKYSREIHHRRTEN